ncbi:tRNA (adenosine(37)-N6)-threonylcarbamoyltransferase complex dimerization subunit type 1 TsaB [Pseudooceanicola sp. C21-150M6]|uniref:tRNA (adenosine(37)-N6)-threonylcarbamoyltransferase complex dimerization subunit type 1 TsaB n=1 Tax=Pseudooceanicola sp. C21-150M6 TaxID=3434355 RepID=UPI003D7F83A7
MITLAFDTSAAHCAAALVSDDHVLATRVEEMTKGQAERLFPLLEEVLAEAGLSWSDLDRIGVGVGPGNFTGVRISVAAARGLALSLGIPAIGVSTFEAVRHAEPEASVAVPAPRDQVYLDRPGASPELLPAELAAGALYPPAPAALATAIAKVARDADPVSAPAPKPLYLRPADAAPPRDAPPEIVA